MTEQPQSGMSMVSTRVHIGNKIAREIAFAMDDPNNIPSSEQQRLDSDLVSNGDPISSNIFICCRDVSFNKIH